MTQVFRLQYESATAMVPILRPLISPNNTINVNPGNNSLVITDYADNLQRMGYTLEGWCYHPQLPELTQLAREHPETPIVHAVKGMLPRTRLGRAQLRKLKVYAGPDHPHAAQKPEPMEVEA